MQRLDVSGAVRPI